MSSRILLLVVLAQLAAPPAVLEPLLLPGSAELVASHLTPGSHINRYAGSPSPDTAVRELYQEEVRLDTETDGTGRRVFRLIRQISNARSAFADTLTFRQNGLVPIAEQMHSGTMRRAIVYHGDSIQVTTQIGDSAPRTEARHFASPVFGFNQLEQIVQSLPLRAGYSAIVPLYSEGSGELETDTVTVTGKNAAGDGWTVRFADPVIVTTYGLDARTRAVTSYEVTPRRGGRYFRIK